MAHCHRSWFFESAIGTAERTVHVGFGFGRKPSHIHRRGSGCECRLVAGTATRLRHQRRCQSYGAAVERPGCAGAAISRTAFGGGAEVRVRPGGGTLEWALGYDARFTAFDELALARDLDVIDHGATLRGRWTFLPQTALLYDGRVGFVHYINDTTRLSNSTPVSSSLGINGLITSKLGALIQGGWKSTFSSSAATRPRFRISMG